MVATGGVSGIFMAAKGVCQVYFKFSFLKTDQKRDRES